MAGLPIVNGNQSGGIAMRIQPVLKLLCATCAFICSVALGQTSLRVNNIITVDASGGPAANCISLRTVLGSILDSSPSNPYHVKLEPGDYDCGFLRDEMIIVPQYVTVEGAGTDTTRIHGMKEGALINLTDGSELRFLAVNNIGDASFIVAYAVGIDSDNAASARVSHVHAESGPTADESFAFLVTSNAPNRPVQLELRHSYAEGATDALKCTGSWGNSRYVIDGTQLVQLVPDGGAPSHVDCADVSRCVNSYDADFNPIPRTCFQVPNFVFVTENTYTVGALGGISGANTICEQSANAAGLPGDNYRAWLSTQITSASEHLYHASNSYILADRSTVVASNWDDLTDGVLLNGINLTEFGNGLSGEVVTGTALDGDAIGCDCHEWASTNLCEFDPFHAGDSGRSDSRWTDFFRFNDCSIQAHLYCIRQP